MVQRKVPRELRAGDQVGELTVLDPGLRIQRETSAGTLKTYRAALVRCSCGAEKVVYQQHLRSGNTRSCGHLALEAARVYHPRSRFIRHRKIRICYRVAPEDLGDRAVVRRIHAGIRHRCLDESSVAYPNYGGRGITIWEPWKDDAEAFITWVLENIGPRPEGSYPSGFPLYTIDRIDNNGPYAPGNLKWSTQPEQCRNTRDQEDELNGIYRERAARNYFYLITRDGEKFAEYGFGSEEEAAKARDKLMLILDCSGPELARRYVERRTEKRRAAAREPFERKAAEAAREREERREAQAAARKEKEDAHRQKREKEKADWARERAERARRWHRMNREMSFSQIAEAEGVTAAYVCVELKRHGFQAVPRKGGYSFHRRHSARAES